MINDDLFPTQLILSVLHLYFPLNNSLQTENKNGFI